MSEFFKGLRLPTAETGKLLMLNEDNKIVSSLVTENDILNRTKLATVAPENPVEGDIYFDAESDKIMAYTGTAWVMQDRIINTTADYEGTFAGSDCFFVDTKGNVVAGETTFYIQFHRDAVGIGNCDLAVNSFGALYLCNPDGTRIVASDIKAGTILECVVKDTGGIPKYKVYAMTPIHHIVNDLTTGGVGYVLSAEQGKVLNEKIETARAELETNMNIADSNLDTKITNVETTLTQKIEEASGGLSGNLTELENRINTKIETADTALEAKITANTEAIESNDTDIETLNTNIKPLLKTVEYDSETCTFTFTTYEGTTSTFDLPLESTVKNGYYDAETENLVLVLMNDTEIKIPATALIDIYTGSEGNQIKVEVSKDNVISAILKADSVDESFLTEALRNRLTTIEADIKANKDSITTLNENAALYDASGDLPFRKDAILKLNQKLLGSNSDGSTHVLAATLGWNIGTEDEFIQNEFGSSTIHTNLNSIDRPTIEMPTGKEEIAYKSELESVQADITAVTEEVKEIVDTEVASLKEKDTAIETEIAGLKTADTTIQETITTLEGKVDTADNEIKASITTLEEKVDTKVEELSTGISQNTTAIEANKTSIDTINEDLENVLTKDKFPKLLIDIGASGSTGKMTIFESDMQTSTMQQTNRWFSVSTSGNGITSKFTRAGQQHNLDISLVPEDITFDVQETGLTSTKLPAAVRELKGLVDTNVTDITNLTTAVEGIENVLDTKLEPIEARITENETNIASNTTAINENKAEVDGKIATLEAKDTELETSISNANKSIFSNTTQIESLSSRIDGVSESIDMKLEPIASQVVDNTNAIEKRVTKTEAKPFIKDITYDGETCTFTFTAYDGTTKVFDLPLESAVKSGYYDAEGQNLVLVLMDETEIKIPATDLIDIYTGKDTDKISLKVNEDNSIEATIVEGSIAKTDLTTELQAELDSKSSASNWANGTGYGSVRTVGAMPESDTYTLGADAVAIGSGARASGRQSFAQGSGANASGANAWAIGAGTAAEAPFAFAIGAGARATVQGAMAIGTSVTASGNQALALGANTKALGSVSIAEGANTTASGMYSHAEGSGTTATGEAQHTQGKYNIEDTENKYAHIVGNGDYKTKSNAHTLDWNGVAWFADSVKVGGTGQDDENAKTLATTEQLEETKSTITTEVDNLKAKDTELEEKVETEISTIEGEISSLTELVSTNTTNIETTNTALTEHIAEFETFKTDNATALEGYVEKASISQHNNGGGFNKSIIDLLNPSQGTAAGFTFHRALIDGTRGDNGYYFNYLLDAPNSDITFTYEDKGYASAGYSNMYHHLAVNSENVTFDALDSGLESTKIAPAIREVKGLVDTNATALGTINTTLETVQGSVTANATAIEDNKTAIAERVTNTEAKTFIKDVAYDGETCTFTFTMYDDTTETFDLPLESAVKTGRYDEGKKALVLVLMDNTEIEIPADNLIDVYTGAEGNQINVSVSSANVISAILNADSIDESFLTEALRTRLTAMETGIADNKTALETVNTTLGNHTTEIAGIQEALANISMEASAITFDNTNTDLTATNVQEALVEINSKIGDILTILEEINGTTYENVNEEEF